MLHSEYTTIEDFVFNKSFREWVINKTNSEGFFWEDWVSDHPEKKEVINHAKAIIYTLYSSFENLSEEEVNAEIKKLLLRLKEEEPDVDFGNNTTKNAAIRKITRSAVLRIAAMLVLVAGSFFLFYYLKGGKQESGSYRQFIANRTNIKLNQTVVTESAKDIILPDGSKVHLKPESKLIYTNDFADNKREVYLSGEAFFDVKRNPAHPFVVYTNRIVARVLGTSFWVNASSNKKEATVTVTSGKVSVFRSGTFVNAVNGNADGGVIITPNQGLVYNDEDKQLNRVLTAEPAPIPEKLVQGSFAFRNTPVKNVFKMMQDAYGIAIVFDEEAVAECSFTANLNGEAFYTQLKLICDATNASYEIIDGTIIITSNGCNK